MSYSIILIVLLKKCHPAINYYDWWLLMMSLYKNKPEGGWEEGIMMIYDNDDFMCTVYFYLPNDNHYSHFTNKYLNNFNN